MPQKHLQEARKQKRTQKAADRAAANAKSFLDPALPQADFTPDRAADVNIHDLYVDADTEAPPPDGALTNDLLNATLPMREEAEGWLTRLARRMPDKEQWSLAGGGGGVNAAAALAERMLTAEYVTARCHSWRWCETMLTRPLCLFATAAPTSEDFHRVEQLALMDSQAYLHAEMQLADPELVEPASAAAAAAAAQPPPRTLDVARLLAARLKPHFTRVILNEKPLGATAQQRLPAQQHWQCDFWLDSATSRLLLLCTITDLTSANVIAHFYIPRLAS